MARHRYPPRALGGDYGRAAAGLAITGAPLLLAGASPWATGICAALAAFFALFAAATVLRQVSAVATSGRGIAREGPLPLRLDWAALDRLSLRYFAVKRGKAGKEGWMQLVLRAGWRRIAIDSRIEGFAEIAALAAEAARRRGLALGAATLANLDALGIEAADGRGDAAPMAPADSRPAR